MAKRPRTQQTLSFYFGGHPGQPDSESSSDSDEELTSRRFLPRWSKKFPWVNYDDVNDVVTCTVCAKAGKRNDYVAGKPRPPRGWRKEYLNRHKNSVDHRNATKEPCMAAQAQNMYEHMLSEAGEQTMVLMKNVYFLARECIAVLKANKLHEHVAMLGCTVPKSHRGGYSSWEFVHVMSELLERDILNELKASQFFSLIGDESNEVAVHKNLILYVKYMKKSEVRLAFLKLLKLDGADAATIYETIMTYIRGNRVDPSKMVMWTSDGAEVMLGKYNGVQAKLKVSPLDSSPLSSRGKLIHFCLLFLLGCCSYDG